MKRPNDFSQSHLQTGGGAMAPLFLPRLISSLTRQLSHVVKFAAARPLPAASAQRCISTVTAALAPARGIFSPVQGLRSPLCSPLVGQCQQLLCVQPSAGMKTKTALKKRCKDCFFVRRRGRLFVYCKTHPRHKQRQG
ncbi:39S ribosomal protein L36, mitochondrial [Astyanax mexicanus]|uniref:Ribosomal protein n=2 Tax=Astyanax mexicanus TaxID=7994 RepID=A0A8T2MCP0_ASTMX|nr:39S ribosomal protein L36, mitochondrial [Astyanax mexicanus]